ncbi:hypothetical protein GTZ99_05035 [Novosphingobium sp. FSY-8]|uniref:Uncharacterized protein n=1 Tax=Novosphingobium ovatum TaxID=1908523 RepID=A0ABW9XBP3_9SPHN|nr:hypothetical protein [Novosphingobium ovatum]NBC35917.1 hypothetical protein [Novosphingobium ovatum]
MSPQFSHSDHAALWARLCAHTIGPADAAQSFAARLAHENGWDAAYADRVIQEYRRFCFLAVASGHPVTPSDAVDQVWHLHLAYTRDYWERFCPDVLRRALHHGPTAGGAVELARYHEQYGQTLRSYEAVFGPAPADLWPDAMQRLVVDPLARRVHPRQGMVVPRARLRLWLALAGAGGGVLGLVIGFALRQV